MKKAVSHYTLTAVEQGTAEKTEALFYNEGGQPFQIVFNGTSALRISGENGQRLFLPEMISGQKTHFLNEYGLEAGKVSSKIYEGNISIDHHTCKFRLTGEDPILEILDSALGDTILSVEVNDELLIHTGAAWSTDYLLHGVCFSFAWCLLNQDRCPG